ncbi:hypothetical protein [Mesorhizobium sp.]|uniref:hypothetical protein n=1 Tax=Mesorhizobium sp. TaxID=1871066 RepID=UPI000FE55A61|nr:hypothetical protein [Mesorhizobium sp.]RWM29783.1 MAG: hypothetical protein EOR75_31895 [Mesorhizobium sp.]TJV47681.1 MAG: hypothetical protein E5Y01_31750 [Mesorhizobium sp.]
MTIYAKSGGVWSGMTPYVKDGGVWKLAEPYLKSGGVWKPLSPKVATLTLVGGATAQGATIAWSAVAGFQAGDLVLLFDQAETLNSIPPTSVIPTGFTNINDFSISAGVSGRSMISHRILDGTEGGNITGMNSGTTLQGKYLLIFRGDRAVSAVVSSAFNNEATTGDPAAQTVAAGSGAAPLIVLGAAFGTGGGSGFSTASPAFDATATFGGSTVGVAGYKVYNSAPANHSIDMADKGNNILSSGYVSIQ